MAVDFNLPTVATSYTAFPTQIIENIDAALQQLSVGSPSNVPTNAIKWDATANRWKKYNGSAYVDLTGTYDLNANVSVNQLDLGDSEKIRLGAGQDLQIFHDQTLGHSFIKDTGTGNLKICGSTVDLVNAGNNALLLKASQGSGGTTSLYQNGDERLKTLSTGVEIFGTSLDLGDNVSLNLGTNDDFKLKHNDTDGIIENTKGILYVKKSDGSGSSQDGIKMEANSKISLFHSTGVSSSPQFETTTNGIFLRGQNLGSSLNDEVIVFDSQVAISNAGKVQIKHVRDATTNTSWTTAATRLQMRVDTTDQGYIQFNGADNNYGVEIGTNGLEKFAYFVRNGKAELYYDNVAKLATASGGVDITGNITASGGQLTLENGNEEQIHRFWSNTSDSDIYGLLSGSTFGTIVEGANNGHHIIGVRDNDGNDSFAIISGGGNFKTGSPADTYDTLIARFKADGNTVIGGNLDVGAGLDVTGGITASSTGNASLILDSGTGSQSGTQVSFIDFKLDGTVKGNIAINEGGTHAGDLEINSAGTGASKLFHNGASTAKLTTTANGISLPSANTATAPALSFGTDTDSGIFHRQADSIGFSAAGQIFYIDTTGLYTNTAKGIHLKALNNSQFLTLKPSDTMASNFSLTFPNADTTVAGYALISDGSGQLSWGVAGGVGAKGGGSDEIFWENGQAVTTNYTITNGKNAGSFGPITINSGVTVTVGNGETWSVV